MPTIYTYKESNIRKTWFYITFFLTFVIFLGWLVSYIFENQAILWISVILAFVMNFFSYWYSDKVVLTLSQAREIKKEDMPELYRIVENLSITAGLPLPKIYLIEESQPNAFATGRNEKNAVIAVTRGLLEKLERAELEGVMAHELAHIGNKDTLLSTIVVVLVGIVALISDLFLRMYLPAAWRRDSRGSSNLILMIIGLVAIILAPLAATLIKLAISRKREFLADASGALLTRYPEGLCRALQKISQSSDPLRTANNATAHLYIINPFRGKEKSYWFHKLFMTHPPVQERIKALRGMQI